MDWNLPRSAAGVELILGLAEDQGVAVDRCLRGTGLDRDAIRLPDAEVLPRQELSVIGKLVDALGDPPGLGVAGGLRYQLTTYGMFGFALLSSPTLRSAIDVGLGFLDLTFAFSRFRVRADGGDVVLVVDAPEVPDRLRRFVIERDVAAVSVICRDLSGAGAASPTVALAFPEPPTVPAEWDAAYGASETTIRMAADLLDERLPRADAHTASLAQAQCRDLLRARSARTGTSGAVLDLLAADPASPPTADAAARALSVSGRTLRHRLAAEGTSYRELLQEMRFRLAVEMLVTARLTVGETATRLGYAEVSSFSQAFHRWAGVGPAEYRRRRLG